MSALRALGAMTALKPAGTEATKGLTGMTRQHKTVMCRFWLQGACRDGDGCSFAHGTEQLTVDPLQAAARTEMWRQQEMEKRGPPGPTCAARLATRAATRHGAARPATRHAIGSK
jgi:hypothetical protein